MNWRIVVRPERGTPDAIETCCYLKALQMTIAFLMLAFTQGYFATQVYGANRWILRHQKCGFVTSVVIEHCEYLN